jgi:hypothetical protein
MDQLKLCDLPFQFILTRESRLKSQEEEELMKKRGCFFIGMCLAVLVCFGPAWAEEVANSESQKDYLAFNLGKVFVSSENPPVVAGEYSAPVTPAQSSPPAQPSNLTLSNFFTAGWGEPWVHRYTPGGAPDMALLHVTTNFLEREFRYDFYTQRNLATDSNRSTDFMDALVAYGVDRRFMLEVVGDYEWKTGSPGNDGVSGAGASLVGRLQLVDVPGSSLAFQFRANSPNPQIGTKTTTLIFTLAGWQDLSMLLGLENTALNRIGLYYHLAEETYAGPASPQPKRNDITYAVSLAKTWNDPQKPVFGCFTTFVEFYATTNLDGSDHGHTDLNMTPGIRFRLYHGHVIIAGIDLPLSNPHEFHRTYRLTYIYNFD